MVAKGFLLFFFEIFCNRTIRVPSILTTLVLFRSAVPEVTNLDITVYKGYELITLCAFKYTTVGLYSSFVKNSGLTGCYSTPTSKISV